MSKKDFNKYVKNISNQYLEMRKILLDFENDKKEDYMSEEGIQNIKKLISPLKTNYDRVMYETFILNQPNRDKKKNKYNKNNLDIINYCTENNADSQSIYDENENVLKELKEYIKTL